jgi:NTE family protein
VPERIIRLLSSLRPLTQGPGDWFSRSCDVNRTPSGNKRLNEPERSDPSLADRTRNLRRAFPLADAASIEALSSICSLMSVPGGVALVLEGEHPEAVYVVVTGLLGAYQPAADGQDVLLDRFGAGDLIGDTGFITGETRTVTIRALRNSELLRIPEQDLRAASVACPGILQALCSAVVQRLQRTQPASASPLKCRTFCLVPADTSIDMKPIIQKIAATLEAFGSVAMIAAAPSSERTSAWFAEVEKTSDFVLLEAECDLTAWTRFCLRQCDRIVLLAHGETEPADCEVFGPGGAGVPHKTPVSLMLLWRHEVVPARTANWLRSVNPNGHHHIRTSADIARASRLMAGRGLGLVLSGGGAKALAHVGVIEALRDQGIEIDAIGGTSIGAIVAAVFAQEWDLGDTVRTLAAAFNRRRFSDFAVPRTALYSERAFARTLGRCFKDMVIEDSPIPLFCVSTNLTAGLSAVHRTGRLLTWLRATSAVPGICPPVVEQNAVYVDGGVLNNLPIDAIRDFGVASVIAVDVGSSLQAQARSDGTNGLPNIVDLLWRVGSIGSDAASRIRRDGDVVLKPEVGSLGLFDWNAHEVAIAAGHQVVLDHLDEIEAAVSRTLDAKRSEPTLATAAAG